MLPTIREICRCLNKEHERRRTIQTIMSEYMNTNAALQGTLLQTQNDSLKVSNLQLELAHQNLALQNKELDLKRAQKELELNMTLQKNTALELEHEKAKQEALIAEQEKREAQQASQQHMLAQRNQKMVVAFIIVVLIAIVGFLILRIRNVRALRLTNQKLTIAHKEAKDNLMKAENNLRLAEENKKRAVQAEQVKNMFIQNISHEIRTPLNAIVGFSQLLTDPETYEALSPEERKGFTELISNNSNLLTKLVNDILSLSDMQSGRNQMTWCHMPVNETCNLCMASQEQFVPQNVRLYYTTELPDDYTLYTDSQRIQIIVNNMLSNACKHTVEGEIHMHASLQENPGYVTISVTDTGTGVPEDKAEVIFSQFEKLDSFLQGGGNGLPICRLIANNLKGEIKLDTSYKKGARFVFLHPIDKP